MGMSDEAGSEASGALTHTATFAIPRGVLVTPGMAGGNRYPPGSEDGKDSIPSGRPVLEGAAGGDLAPMGNCRLYKNVFTELSLCCAVTSFAPATRACPASRGARCSCATLLTRGCGVAVLVAACGGPMFTLRKQKRTPEPRDPASLSRMR
jgi:hypothetical protein